MSINLLYALLFRSVSMYKFGHVKQFRVAERQMSGRGRWGTPGAGSILCRRCRRCRRHPHNAAQGGGPSSCPAPAGCACRWAVRTPDGLCSRAGFSLAPRPPWPSRSAAPARRQSTGVGGGAPLACNRRPKTMGWERSSFGSVRKREEAAQALECWTPRAALGLPCCC